MKLILSFEDGTQSVLPIKQADRIKFGNATYYLPQWFEKYNSPKQVEALNRVCEVDCEDSVVISIPIEHPKYNLCDLFYLDELETVDNFDRLINTDKINTDEAFMYVLSNSYGEVFEIHFNN